MRHAPTQRCTFQKCGFSTIKLLVKYENMNRQEKDQCDGDAAMENQNDGELIQDHAEQAGGKRNHNQRKQQPPFCTQFPTVDYGMDNAEQ